MSHTFYNSLDLTCKSPFGAVKAGQPVTFNLTVPEDLGYVDPHLVLTKDREDPVHYRMEFTGQTPKVNHFALTVTPTTSGLYFLNVPRMAGRWVMEPISTWRSMFFPAHSPLIS